MFIRLLGVFLWTSVLLIAEPFIIADKVIVKKSTRMLYLSQNGEIFNKYHITLGRVPVGDKEVEGDMKTPEGAYLLDYRQFSNDYYKSLHVSYPNTSDKAHAASLGKSPGGMIMIHGTPPSWSLSPYGDWMNVLIDWTEGCIAMSNDDMDEVWEQTTNGTVVVILP
ncbi:MAG: ErfK/YbiS/YcfS/YnhG family protein [uncultured Sulfurovum sp.]|uniref:ErfK/YbiS/YcfS/YnhG family protein n=1 Tax=uncultured Sulfurovum sp. TaxID=269237 RepID=A0A6S6TF36_9BACT|nr:MAG: ErfK/YbiS/YcfS/YnhG family protein [uncultured Sulfurovum sp.]